MPAQIQLRRDTAANWASSNPILAEAEPGIETDTGKTKYGDGVTAWNDLEYAYGRPDVLDELDDVTFVDDPQNGQVLRYDGNQWVNSASAGTTGTVSVYDTFEQLAIANPQIGQMAYVNDTKALYIWVGNLWYNIAISDQAFSITGNEASYTLTAGSDTVVTLIAVDPEGNPITWSYNVISGSLNDTTVDLQNNVFIVTPGENNASFTIRWTATDGVNTISAQSDFTLVVDSSQTSWANLEQVGRLFPGTVYTDAYGGNASYQSGDRPYAGWLTDTAFFVIAKAFNTQRARIYIWEQQGTQWVIKRTSNLTNDQYTNPSNILVQQRDDTSTYFNSSHVTEWDIWFYNPHFGGVSKSIVAYRNDGEWVVEDFDYGVSDNTTYVTGQNRTTFDIVGNTLITGYGQQYIGGLVAAGDVQVYTRSSGINQFVLEATITAPDLDSYEYFGFGAALISETEMVVGAWGSEDSGSGSDSGTIYLYKKSGGNWNYDSRLPYPTNLDATDYLGRTLLYKNGLLFSYNPQAGLGTNSGPGRCFIYQKDENGDWIYKGQVPAPTDYTSNTAGDMFSVIDFDGTSFVQSDLSSFYRTFVYEWDGTSMNYITEVIPAATFDLLNNKYAQSPIVRNDYLAVSAVGDSSPVIPGQTFVFQKK